MELKFVGKYKKKTKEARGGDKGAKEGAITDKGRVM